MKIREVQWLIPLEDKGNDSLLLFTACDKEYLHYATSLIRSVDSSSPGFSFVLHLINPDEATLGRARRLASSLTSTRLAVSFEKTDLSELDESQKPAYYASARFPQIANLLNQHQRPVFSLDADSLVVNPIDLNFSDKEDAEVVLVRRDLTGEMPEHLSIATGSIFLKPTEGVRHFIGQVAEEIDRQLQECALKWFVDQIVFYRQMQAMQKKVHFYNLKGKYADWDFRENSIVWAGKGARKENDLRFFLLQAALSDDIERNAVADELWRHLTASRSNLTGNSWLHSRIETGRKPARAANDASKPVQRIALFIPRLDLPWKRGNDPAAAPPALADDVLDLRLHWKEFAIRIANAIERAGMPVEIIEIPGWEINRQTIDASGAALALVPHRCNIDFENGIVPVRFYMQEYYRWVFVVDKQGWSAASSIYPINLETLPPTANDSFDDYRERMLEGRLGSKFAQPERKNRRKLIAEGLIPSRRNSIGLRQGRPYIFFPLQIPHDQSIRYFSDLPELAVLEGLVDWARKREIALVMKPHPASPKSMAPFKALVDGHTIFWSDSHVYDLIAFSSGVYTINSGVGFESLFHCKPVVTFGKVEYDCVSFRASPGELDAAWEYCQTTDPKALEDRYRRFINWFLADYAVDMSRPEDALSRLDKLAADIVAQARETSLRQVS